MQRFWKQSVLALFAPSSSSSPIPSFVTSLESSILGSKWLSSKLFLCLLRKRNIQVLRKFGKRCFIKTSLAPVPIHCVRPSCTVVFSFTNPFLGGCNNEDRIMQYLNNPSQFLVAWPRLPGACSLERSGGHFGFVSWDWSLVCCCSTEEQPRTPSSWTMDIAEWRVRFPPSIFKPSRFDL